MGFELPADAVAALRSGFQFEYDPASCEPGRVGLTTFDELSASVVWVGTDADGDPNAGIEGYYLVPAVSLTRECEAYEPEFILLWLPNEKQFGTWDSDHWGLTVFPDVGWPEIAANPAAYLSAQWDPEPSKGVRFEAWRDYELQLGRPF